MPLTLSATGSIEPLRTAAVMAQVGGVVKRIRFREGDDVRAGQLLLELDTRPLRAARDRAAADLARDRAEANVAHSEAERARALREKDLLSPAEVDAKVAAAAAAAAAVQADEAALRAANVDLSYASVRAPIGGRTGRLTVHEGDLVRAAAGDPLVVINQTRPVRVRFTVPASALPLLEEARRTQPRVTVRTGDDDVPAEGPLVFVDNAVDPASGTLLLKGEIDNGDGRFVPGQTVDVRLVLSVDPNALVVPAVAVTTGQQGAFVYVLQPDSTVASRPVVVRRADADVAVIASGLARGETVVTDGQLRLSPGAKVLVQHPERDAR